MLHDPQQDEEDEGAPTMSLPSMYNMNKSGHSLGPSRHSKHLDDDDDDDDDGHSVGSASSQRSRTTRIQLRPRSSRSVSRSRTRTSSDAHKGPSSSTTTPAKDTNALRCSYTNTRGRIGRRVSRTRENSLVRSRRSLDDSEHKEETTNKNDSHLDTVDNQNDHKESSIEQEDRITIISTHTSTSAILVMTKDGQDDVSDFSQDDEDLLLGCHVHVDANGISKPDPKLPSSSRRSTKSLSESKHGGKSNKTTHKDKDSKDKKKKDKKKNKKSDKNEKKSSSSQKDISRSGSPSTAETIPSLSYHGHRGDETEPCMYENVETIRCQLEIHKAEDLVAKDRTLFGKHATSDPYVEVWRNLPTTKVGKTDTKYKTLCPEFEKSFLVTWSHKELQRSISRQQRARVELKIWDYDKLSGADHMGDCSISLPLSDENCVITKQWYLVDKLSATHAKGRVQVSLRVTYEMRN
eukprot:scaffold13655_cov191-Amphora_coffeaeformis.AAC.2